MKILTREYEDDYKGKTRHEDTETETRKVRRHLLPLLESILLSLVEEICLGAAQVDYLRTTVSLKKERKTFQGEKLSCYRNITQFTTARVCQLQRVDTYQVTNLKLFRVR